MRFVHYTNSVSAHQLPFDRELVARIGADEFRYVTANVGVQENQTIAINDTWLTTDTVDLETCETLLVGGLRPIDMMERRLQSERMTLYASERWFKPIRLFRLRFGLSSWLVYLPGWLRMLSPAYYRMARRFARLFQSHYYRYLPIGPWAERDMATICRLTGCTMSSNKIIPWGYYVASSSCPRICTLPKNDNTVRVLWVGRMLDWKRVDTIIRAVAYANGIDPLRRRFTLTLVGGGPEECYLRRLATALAPNGVVFSPRIPIAEIRPVMRAHDVYVLASNACEGWGAALNEAMEEGMMVLGTYEAGASAALLVEEALFHTGDWRDLATKLVCAERHSTTVPIRGTPVSAAKRILGECRYKNED